VSVCKKYKLFSKLTNFLRFSQNSKFQKIISLYTDSERALNSKINYVFLFLILSKKISKKSILSENVKNELRGSALAVHSRKKYRNGHFHKNRCKIIIYLI